MGLPGPSKHPRNSLAAIRFTAAATSFQRPHGIPELRCPAPRCRKLPWTSASLQGTPNRPRRSPKAPTNPHGISRLYSDMGVKVHGPGLPTPVRSACRVSHPLDGLLPSRCPATRTGAAHEVHPTEPFPSAEPHVFRRRCPPAVSGIACSCSEDQEFTMPRSSRALLPAEIRTCDSRGCGRPMLSWASDASPEHSPQAAEPASRNLPSCASHTRTQGDRMCGAPGL
jgi:hypothetical protein